MRQAYHLASFSRPVGFLTLGCPQMNIPLCREISEISIWLASGMAPDQSLSRFRIHCQRIKCFRKTYHSSEQARVRVLLQFQLGGGRIHQWSPVALVAQRQ